MKEMAMVAPESEEVEAPEDQAQSLLLDGKALCEMGQKIIDTAKAMGAVDEAEEESGEDSEGDGQEEAQEETGEDYEEDGGGEAEGAPEAGKRAIIALIRKKMGK